jgi:hypothetical protein
MSTQADVKSIDTLAFIKAALAKFGHESGQALGEVEIQSQRIVEWICVDQAAYWKAEVRRCADLVNQAVKDLEHCRTYKKVGDNQPSCAEEKKALEKARQRLARAEQKQEAVRRWAPVVRQQSQETGVRLTRFREVIDLDCPKAMARLERMLQALDSYQHAAAPRIGEGTAGAAAGGATTGDGPQGASVARPVDEPAPAASPPPEAGPPEASGGQSRGAS